MGIEREKNRKYQNGKIPHALTLACFPTRKQTKHCTGQSYILIEKANALPIESNSCVGTDGQTDANINNSI